MKRFADINELDLHGCLVNEAQALIGDKLDELYQEYPDQFDRLIIIHGYSHGDQLLNLVRRRKDYRIRRIRTVASNPGMTIYELKSWDEIIDDEQRRRNSG